MTEEEINRERERDRKRYAKKKAVKITVEQKQSTTILEVAKFANTG